MSIIIEHLTILGDTDEYDKRKTACGAPHPGGLGQYMLYNVGTQYSAWLNVMPEARCTHCDEIAQLHTLREAQL
jgi:hypothetical protein